MSAPTRPDPASRCFGDNSPLYARYHDEEWGVPVHDDRVLFEFLILRNARAFLEVRREFGSFDEYSWRFVGGKPKQNEWPSLREIPAKTSESDALSKDLKKRGFTFVGSTIMYAWMQAVGMVNDHKVTCPRWKSVSALLLSAHVPSAARR